VQEFDLHTESDRQMLLNYFKNLDISRPLKVQWKLWKPARSLNANALFHIWVGEIRAAANGRGMETTKDQVKESLKKMFLGYEKNEYADPKTGEMITKIRLRRTRDLDSGEMFFFMERCQEWAFRMLELTLTSRNNKDEFAQWQQQEVA